MGPSVAVLPVSTESQFILFFSLFFLYLNFITFYFYFLFFLAGTRWVQVGTLSNGPQRQNILLDFSLTISYFSILVSLLDFASVAFCRKHQKCILSSSMLHSLVVVK